MNNSDIEVRKVTLNDDFESIAELIYETDEYIYTYWFHDNVEEAKKVLPPLMKEEGFFYNYKSMYIAIDKTTNKIVGLTCIVTPDTNLDYDYTKLREKDETYSFTIDNYVMDLIKEVEELKLPYVSNVAVHHDYRGKKIGTIMMEYVIEDKKGEYHKFLLDVLSENPSAIKLYQRIGFEITSPETMGIGKGPNNQVGQYSMELDISKKR